jgi:TupA-like ATPgrasp
MVENQFRILNKPPNWSNMLLCNKIRYYGSQLHEGYAPYVDKIEVKEIVKKICGDRIKVAPIFRTLKDAKDIYPCDLYPNLLLKASHGSSWLYNIQSDSNVDKIMHMLAKWNRPWIYKNEKQYSHLKPRFFLEEKIHCYYNGANGNAVDFKIFCIHGKPAFILFRKNDVATYYTPDWTYFGDRNRTNKDPQIPRPIYLDEMITIATELSQPFEFVRIDLYMAMDGVYFGEYTFTPKNGNREFNDELELKFGRLWI